MLYDLGSHLIDQALCLFGTPQTVWADLSGAAARRGAVDYAHLVLGYGPLRVLLHAGSLVRAPGPRFEVHGDRGSFVKDGIDGQIAALLAGGRPGDPGWGDGAAGSARHADDRARRARVSTGRLASVPGSYEAFYRAMAAAVRGDGPVPVPAGAGPRRHPGDRVRDAQQPGGPGGGLRLMRPAGLLLTLGDRREAEHGQLSVRLARVVEEAGRLRGHLRPRLVARRTLELLNRYVMRSRPPTSTKTWSGCATMLWYQPGWRADPPYDATMYQPPAPSSNRATGFVRGSPDRAPTVFR